MRIAYVAGCNFMTDTGVTKKIRRQMKFWISLGHIVRVFSFARKTYAEELIMQYVYLDQPLTWGTKGLPELVADVKGFSPDVVYLRDEPYKLFFKDLSALPLILEVNSDAIAEYFALALSLAKDVILNKNRLTSHKIIVIMRRIYAGFYELLSRGKKYALCKGIIAPTHELAGKLSKWPNISQITIPNSIEIPNSLPDFSGDANLYRLVFIGSPSSNLWHGIDILERLANRLPESFLVDIVGCNGPSTKKIVYHGYLAANEYQRLMSRGAVGVSTLALFRKRMSEACPLKTREYLALGLPVIIGYHDTAFADLVPKWVLEVPNNDSWIEDPQWIQKVISFVKAMNGKRIPASESRQYIDATIIEYRRLEFLKKQIGWGNDTLLGGAP